VHEERLLATKFGEQYQDYCKAVPRFLPRLSRTAGDGRFSMSTLIANNEFQGAAGTALLALLLGSRC
jgi:hypothetical protein